MNQIAVEVEVGLRQILHHSIWNGVEGSGCVILIVVAYLALFGDNCHGMIHYAVGCHFLAIVVAVDAAVVSACLFVGINIQVGREVVFTWGNNLSKIGRTDINLQSVVACIRRAEYQSDEGQLVVGSPYYDKRAVGNFLVDGFQIWLADSDIRGVGADEHVRTVEKLVV